MRLIRSTLLLCLVTLSCACQITSFQTPPLADSDCDRALVGRWQSVDESGKPDGDMTLQIAANCQLVLIDESKDKPSTSEPTRLHVAQANGQRYAWVDMAWGLRTLDAKDVVAEAGDVSLFRYQVQGTKLVGNGVDHKAVAHRIIDGKIPGTVRSDDSALANRITGPARPELLDLPELISKDSARFQRLPGAP